MIGLIRSDHFPRIFDLFIDQESDWRNSMPERTEYIIDVAQGCPHQTIHVEFLDQQLYYLLMLISLALLVASATNGLYKRIVPIK